MASTSLQDVASGSGNPVASFSKFLDTYKQQLALALPKHMKADRVARLVLTAFSQSEGLQNCNPRTIIAAVMTASQMGLEIGVSGQGYLIPYKTTCTFVPGWQGIVDIVNRSGRATVWTGAVFEGDDFDYALGDSPFVRHKPRGETDDPLKITHVYACGRVNGADHAVIEVWPINKVKRHFAKMNKVGARHYANTYWEMYARKLPLLQVCKYMPKSIELVSAMSMANASDSGMGEGYTIDSDFKTVPVDVETGETRPDPLQNKTQEHAASTANKSQGLPTGKTFHQYETIIKADKTTQDTAAIELDEAKEFLDPEGYAKLSALYKDRFGG